jgi:hypothetical protein
MKKIIFILLCVVLISLTGATKAQKQHDYVDLGLPSGTLWSTCNLGASNPGEYGDYYAWGETSTKTIFTWETYKYAKDGSHHKLTKYCHIPIYGGYQYTDSLAILERSDDAAYVQWGSNWCTPTTEQFKELYDNCDHKWIKQYEGKDIAGMLFTSNINGKTIFFPAAGRKRDHGKVYCEWEEGVYMSTELDLSCPSSSKPLYFNLHMYINTAHACGRCAGICVRPVRRSK